MQYPKIYLAADNCFAYKRWTRPRDWARVIAGLGIRYVECSSDTEMDPLYMGREYLRDWIPQVREAAGEYNLTIANLYSGHGTYTTLGLAHWDEGVRRRMMEDWFYPLVDTAAELGAGVGFYAHAFDGFVLQDCALYARYMDILTDNLAGLAAYAKKLGGRDICVEQMYTPHQVPFTLEGAAALIGEVSRRGGRGFYITEDVGHHHNKFLRPDREAIRSHFKEARPGLWLGSDKAYAIYDRARERGVLWDRELYEIEREMDKLPHLFSSAPDADCYNWLERLGAYAPIVHLQQTDGCTSAHRPFTHENNLWGKIDGLRLLKALKSSYDRPGEPGMPKKVDAVYLTLELFIGTADIPHDAMEGYRTSVDYWRHYVPEDGLRLDELLKRLG